jgi:signal transduction histidine kinase
MATRSLQFRVPLALVVSAFATTFIVVLVLAVETYFNLQEDQIRLAYTQSFTLQPVLKQALKHDDPWQAYTVLHGPDNLSGIKKNAEFKVLLDTDSDIFSSGEPRIYPIGKSLAILAPYLVDSLKQASMSQQPITLQHNGRTILIAPILEEGISLGTLVYFSRNDVFWNRFIEIMKGASIAIILIFGVLAPIGWKLGKRLVTPLVRLVDCMQQVGNTPIEDIKCIAFPHQDEIGRLGRQFSVMLEDLKIKRELENQLVTQDRLAAIGRLAGGVAHEINNPLASMLVEIDTWNHSPDDAKDTSATMSFIERGLQHIQETVSALLVECRFEKRMLQPIDVDDLMTLIRNEDHSKNINLQFENQITREVNIPATLVRQILLNLSLNALQAIPESGTIFIRVTCENQQLILQVGDDGHMIPQEVIKHIFEPFQTERPGGTGLGLWVTYETVRQLDGEITVESTDEWTCFTVSLPEIDIQQKMTA